MSLIPAHSDYTGAIGRNHSQVQTVDMTAIMYHHMSPSSVSNFENFPVFTHPRRIRRLDLIIFGLIIAAWRSRAIQFLWGCPVA